MLLLLVNWFVPILCNVIIVLNKQSNIIIGVIYLNIGLMLFLFAENVIEKNILPFEFYSEYQFAITISCVLAVERLELIL